MVYKYFALLLAFLVVPISSRAGITEPDFREIPVHVFVYIAKLPEPFGEVKVTITEEGIDREVQSFVIETMGRAHVVKGENFGGIRYLSLPDFLVLDSEANADGTIKEFEVAFGYGIPVKILLDDETPGCESPCHVLMKSIIKLKVDRHGFVEVDIRNPENNLPSPDLPAFFGPSHH
tara:strand:+ start:983 stop:1513 length:531 start_codon:yes stop_codon:yes gene_type:complete